MSDRETVTRLLLDWKNGDRQAEQVLTPLVYDELKRLAASYLRRQAGGIVTMQPTALVHEAYMRLVSGEQPDWESRAHFYGIAARLMRNILVDYARKQKSEKRGGGVRAETLDEAFAQAGARPNEMVALDDALKALERLDERKSRVIELRFFGGLSVEETAAVLKISVATVGREQRMAEAWLHREMRGEGG